MKRSIRPFENVFSVVSLILFSQGFYTIILGNAMGGDEGDLDSALLRFSFIFIYLITSALLFYRLPRTLTFLKTNLWLIFLIGLAAASIFWSGDTSLAFRKVVSLVGTSLFSLYLGSRYSFEEQLKIYGWTFGIGIFVSLLFVFVLPSHGIMSSGAWRGIYPHKNGLGESMTIGFLTFYFLSLLSKQYRLFFQICCLLSVFLILFGKSATSLISVIFIFTTARILKNLSLKSRKSVFVLLLCIITCFILLFLLAININTFLGVYDRDITLTGRTPLWATLWEFIQEKPWLGYGYGIFFSGSHRETNMVWSIHDWIPPHAHNGFIHIWLDVGIVGLVVFCFGYFKSTFDSLFKYLISKDTKTLWIFLLLLYSIFFNLTEVSFLSQGMLWILSIAAIYSMQIDSEKSVRVKATVSPIPQSDKGFGHRKKKSFSLSRTQVKKTKSSDYFVVGRRQIIDGRRQMDRLQGDSEGVRVNRIHALDRPNLPPTVDSPYERSSYSSEVSSKDVTSALDGDLQPQSMKRDMRSGIPFGDNAVLDADNSSGSSVSPSLPSKEKSGKKRAIPLLDKLFESERIKNSWAIFQSFAFQLVVQGFYFVILARSFAPERYGAYVGIVSIVAIFMPFSTWGSEQLIIQNVSRDRLLFREAWGTGILKTLIFGCGFISLILVVYSFVSIPTVSIYAVFFVALANLIFLRLNDIVRDSFTGVGLLNYTARAIFLVSLNRFFASLLLVGFFSNPSILTWTMLYCLATFCSAAMSTYLIVKQLGYPKLNLANVATELRLGFSYAIGISARSIYNELDKSMLAKFSTLQSAGIYGAAYHILNVAFTPIMSLAMASFRNFFQQGVSGIKGSFELCKKLLPLSLVYSVVAIIGLAVCAPIIPLILGAKYSDSAIAVVWLSPIIFFRTMHIFAANTLTGANLQSVRSSAQVAVAIFNAVLNFWLIPLYSWHGAIWATIASEFLLMIILWSAVYFYSKKTARPLK